MASSAGQGYGGDVLCLPTLTMLGALPALGWLSVQRTHKASLPRPRIDSSSWPGVMRLMHPPHGLVIRDPCGKLDSKAGVRLNPFVACQLRAAAMPSPTSRKR